MEAVTSIGVRPSESGNEVGRRGLVAKPAMYASRSCGSTGSAEQINPCGLTPR